MRSPASIRLIGSTRVSPPPRHEVGVAGPPRHAVDVQVVGLDPPAARAEVDPDVHAVAAERRLERHHGVGTVAQSSACSSASRSSSSATARFGSTIRCPPCTGTG